MQKQYTFDWFAVGFLTLAFGALAIGIFWSPTGQVKAAEPPQPTVTNVLPNYRITDRVYDHSGGLQIMTLVDTETRKSYIVIQNRDSSALVITPKLHGNQ